MLLELTLYGDRAHATKRYGVTWFDADQLYPLAIGVGIVGTHLKSVSGASDAIEFVLTVLLTGFFYIYIYVRSIGAVGP